jgi:hypothetical protein
MKLYTLEQLQEAYNRGHMDGRLNNIDYSITDVLAPIELPSDEEMANASNHCKDGQVKVGFLRGVLWYQEQILNQNK